MTHIAQINQGLKMAGGKQSYIPVVYVSNVDGYYLDVVKYSMMTIEPRDLWINSSSNNSTNSSSNEKTNETDDDNVNAIIKFFRKKLELPDLGRNYDHKGSTFYIDNAYNPKGVGLVISGINRGDDIKVDDELYLGPINKTFIKIKIRSMHNDNRENVTHFSNHHRGCIAIKPLKDNLRRNQICRGMVLISNKDMIKNVCYNFEAAVTIFGGHSATLRTGYSPVVHAGTIRQTAKLILPDDNLTLEEQDLITAMSKRERKEKAQKKIKSGDVERVKFKFRIRPEYLDPGTVFVFRSGDIHGVGCVINVKYIEDDEDAQPEPAKKKFRKIRPSDASKMNSEKKPIEKISIKN
jgi:GTPase